MKRINLVPLEARQGRLWTRLLRRLSSDRLLQAGVLVIAAATLLYGGQVLAMFRYQAAAVYASGRIHRLEAEAREKNGVLAELGTQQENAEREAERLEKRLAFLRAARKQEIAWSAILNEISQRTPEEAWISRIRIHDRDILIDGMTLDNALVSRYMTALDESGRFESTGFNFTQKEELLEQSFTRFEIKTELSANGITP